MQVLCVPKGICRGLRLADIVGRPARGQKGIGSQAGGYFCQAVLENRFRRGPLLRLVACNCLLDCLCPLAVAKDAELEDLFSAVALYLDSDLLDEGALLCGLEHLVKPCLHHGLAKLFCKINYPSLRLVKGNPHVCQGQDSRAELVLGAVLLHEFLLVWEHCGTLPPCVIIVYECGNCTFVEASKKGGGGRHLPYHVGQQKVRPQDKEEKGIQKRGARRKDSLDPDRPRGKDDVRGQVVWDQHPDCLFCRPEKI